MDELISRPEESAGNTAPEVEFYLGTVNSWNSADGIQITIDGQSAANQKKYKILYVCRPLPVGARVIVMKISGSYIVLGEFGLPIGFYRQATLASSASLADVISALNTVINALRTQGVIWPPNN